MIVMIDFSRLPCRDSKQGWGRPAGLFWEGQGQSQQGKWGQPCGSRPSDDCQGKSPGYHCCLLQGSQAGSSPQGQCRSVTCCQQASIHCITSHHFPTHHMTLHTSRCTLWVPQWWVLAILHCSHPGFFVLRTMSEHLQWLDEQYSSLGTHSGAALAFEQLPIWPFWSRAQSASVCSSYISDTLPWVPLWWVLSILHFPNLGFPVLRTGLGHSE